MKRGLRKEDSKSNNLVCKPTAKYSFACKQFFNISAFSERPWNMGKKMIRKKLGNRKYSLQNRAKYYK